MTLAVDPSQGGDSLKCFWFTLFLLKWIKVNPPQNFLINFHVFPKQMAFEPSTVWVLGWHSHGCFIGVSFHQHLEAAMVARACEDLEPLRVAIEKAREV